MGATLCLIFQRLLGRIVQNGIGSGCCKEIQIAVAQLDASASFERARHAAVEVGQGLFR
jgi:hypothetical protein